MEDSEVSHAQICSFSRILHFLWSSVVLVWFLIASTETFNTLKTCILYYIHASTPITRGKKVPETEVDWKKRVVGCEGEGERRTIVMDPLFFLSGNFVSSSTRIAQGRSKSTPPSFRTCSDRGDIW